MQNERNGGTFLRERGAFVGKRESEREGKKMKRGFFVWDLGQSAVSLCAAHCTDSTLLPDRLRGRRRRDVPRRTRYISDPYVCMIRTKTLVTIKALARFPII